jgi:prepilin-type N-terminal cleavage/methylation domain-containing protein
MTWINNRGKGFTLIELLVVVAIIGVLSSVVLASLNSARAKARDAKRMSDIKQIQNAIELYIVNNGSAPDVFDIDRDNWSNLLPLLVPTYISQLPRDPLDCSLPSCKDTNPGPNGDWFAYVYKGPSILINEGLNSYTDINNSSYMIFAENLETNDKSTGFGSFFPGSF